MAVRDISKPPAKRLRLVSEQVKRIDDGIRKLVDDMFDTMYKAPGIGLAAIQIGVPKRVVILDLSKKEDDHKPLVFINPEVTWTSEEKSKYEEGCLSIPEYYEEVERPAKVKVKYLDRDGKPHETEAKGLLATCLQHEIDHINGVLVFTPKTLKENAAAEAMRGHGADAAVVVAYGLILPKSILETFPLGCF